MRLIYSAIKRFKGILSSMCFRNILIFSQIYLINFMKTSDQSLNFYKSNNVFCFHFVWFIKSKISHKILNSKTLWYSLSSRSSNKEIYHELFSKIDFIFVTNVKKMLVMLAHHFYIEIMIRYMLEKLEYVNIRLILLIKAKDRPY